jgi:hypothetical protein
MADKPAPTSGEEPTTASKNYPRSFQVSTTDELGDTIERIAKQTAAARGLPRASVSLVIREALEAKYGGAYNYNPKAGKQ